MFSPVVTRSLAPIAGGEAGRLAGGGEFAGSDSIKSQKALTATHADTGDGTDRNVVG